MLQKLRDRISFLLAKYANAIMGLYIAMAWVHVIVWKVLLSLWIIMIVLVAPILCVQVIQALLGISGI